MPNMSRRSIHAYDTDTSQVNYQSSSQNSGRTTESGFSDGTEAGSLNYTLEDYHDTSHRSNFATRYEKDMGQYVNHKEVSYSVSRDLSYPRQRYFSKFSSRFCDKFQFDSDAELDEMDALASPSIKTKQKWRIVQWFTYLTTFITIWYRKTIDFFKFRTNRRRYYNPQLYPSYRESKWEALWTFLNHYSHKVYFFFVKLLVLDTWLLSQFDGTRKWLHDKCPKIIWIALLPLLLLIGAYIMQEHFFTCVDSLRKVQYGVTETTYYTFNDITTYLTSIDYTFFVKYFANLQNYFMHILPSVNVSLPEIPPIGWNITW